MKNRLSHLVSNKAIAILCAQVLLVQTAGAWGIRIGIIAREFKVLSSQPFRWSASPEGVTVVLHNSEACLMPTISHNAVDVVPGPCR